MDCTRPALRTPLSVTTSTRFAPTCCSGVATVSATPRPKLMRVGMRKTSTRVGVTRAMLGSGASARCDRRTGIRWRAATHSLAATLAICAPRAPRKRLAVVTLDVRVDAHEQQCDERGEDRAPEREEEDPDAARKAHGYAVTLDPTTGSVCNARGTSKTDALAGRPMCSYAISRASSTSTAARSFASRTTSGDSDAATMI